jgi:hypothetical protein
MKIMEGTNKKNDECKEFIFIVLLVIAAIGVISGMILQKDKIPAGHIIASFCGLIIISVVLIFLIKHNIKSNKNEHFSCFTIISRTIISLVINLLFVTSTTAFIVDFNENVKNLYILIISPIALVLLLIIVYIFTNIKNGDDISSLKATTYFVTFILSVIKLLDIGNINKDFLIEYYYLLPILLVQGLYELLDSKSKRKNNSKAQE